MSDGPREHHSVVEPGPRDRQMGEVRDAGIPRKAHPSYFWTSLFREGVRWVILSRLFREQREELSSPEPRPSWLGPRDGPPRLPPQAGGREGKVVP